MGTKAASEDDHRIYVRGDDERSSQLRQIRCWLHRRDELGLNGSIQMMKSCREYPEERDYCPTKGKLLYNVQMVNVMLIEKGERLTAAQQGLDHLRRYNTSRSHCCR